MINNNNKLMINNYLSISILLSKAIIDAEDLARASPASHEEVIWFDISVDKVLVVEVLDSADHLVAQHQHRLQ